MSASGHRSKNARPAAHASSPYVGIVTLFNDFAWLITALWRSRNGVRRGAAAIAVALVCGVAAGAAQAQPQSLSQSEGAATAELRLMVIGDSLTAGFGLPASRAFPAQLEAALRAKGRVVRVLNAGVSGDTSAGGKARVEWALADKPDAVLLELGANDGLRGIDPQSTYGNLAAILSALKARGIPAFLAGMYAPPNLGAAYGTEFRAVYTRLAAEFDVPLYPFFLDGVAAQPKLNQADGIHPNAEGVAVIVARILPPLETWLARVRAK